MKKLIKYLLSVALLLFVTYHSVYFRKLSEVRNKKEEKFDAAAYVRKLWDNQLGPKLDSAVELTDLIKAINTDPGSSFEKYTNALAIGNYRYAFVKVSGVVTDAEEDELKIEIPSAGSMMTIDVATEFIYGNAIRDASRLVEVKDFPNTTDLNNISEEMDKIVRAQVVPSFKKQVKKGDKLSITGAVQINKAHISWLEPEIIPVRLQIIN